MTEKKKMGRPFQDKVRKTLTLDREIVEYLDSLPDGERSRFVNESVAKEIARLKAPHDHFIAYAKGLSGEDLANLRIGYSIDIDEMKKGHFASWENATSISEKEQKLAIIDAEIASRA